MRSWLLRCVQYATVWQDELDALKSATIDTNILWVYVIIISCPKFKDQELVVDRLIYNFNEYLVFFCFDLC